MYLSQTSMKSHIHRTYPAGTWRKYNDVEPTLYKRHVPARIVNKADIITWVFGLPQSRESIETYCTHWSRFCFQHCTNASFCLMWFLYKSNMKVHQSWHTTSQFILSAVVLYIVLLLTSRWSPSACASLLVLLIVIAVNTIVFVYINSHVA